MTEPIISAKGLSKQYRIGERGARYRTVRDSVAQLLRRPFQRKREPKPTEEDTIWALRDICFDVYPGEVIGLIGRNGAGKSTLLKVLSEITYPTEGEVEIRGRVGSLLEVGTGFHPELTGRENIFLNGAILGMTKAEIRRKFDEIVAFAEVEKFINTPVKRYSSGMYVRLAFAVAAHLEPEILLIDEVLAVGDAQFRKKCMGKMGDVAQNDGRTIVFVSHNLSAVQEICSKAIVIDKGKIHCIDESSRACEEYIRMVSGPEQDAKEGHVRGGRFELRGITVEGENGRLPAPLEPATITIPVWFSEPCPDPRIHLFVQTTEGETVFGFGSQNLIDERRWTPSHEYSFRFHVKQLPLLPGPHGLAVKVYSAQLGLNEMLHTNYRFHVSEAPVYGTASPSRHWHGLAVVDATATVTPLP